MIDWDDRFREPGYAYGTQPNDFLASVVDQIPRGAVLSLADGEGRNSVFLAECGHDVTAVDRSAVGVAKAAELAADRGVAISSVLADLAQYVIQPDAWSGIVAIFAHVPLAIRVRMHRGVVAGLKPGGVYVLEAYTPRQLAFTTGGPRDLDLLMDLPSLQRELSGLDFLTAHEIERHIVEGRYHGGLSAVVQILARKPGA